MKQTNDSHPDHKAPLKERIERAIGKIETSLAHQAVLREQGHQYTIKQQQGESK